MCSRCRNQDDVHKPNTKWDIFLHTKTAAGEKGSLLGMHVISCVPQVKQQWPDCFSAISQISAFKSSHLNIDHFCIPTATCLICVRVWRLRGDGKMLMIFLYISYIFMSLWQVAVKFSPVHEQFVCDRFQPFFWNALELSIAPNDRQGLLLVNIEFNAEQ